MANSRRADIFKGHIHNDLCDNPFRGNDCNLAVDACFALKYGWRYKPHLHSKSREQKAVCPVFADYFSSGIYKLSLVVGFHHNLQA
jgi:hypothetical protein